VKYVLDTNAVSALMKGDPNVVNRLERVSRIAVAVPQPVFSEIAYGIERLPRSRRRDLLRARFERLRAELSSVEWSDAVTDAFGRIKALLEKRGKRIEDFDAAIAAHASAHQAILVSANTDDMTRIASLVVEDWSR
jgi:tRNA(fMet)-specific endonuclease VapC